MDGYDAQPSSPPLGLVVLTIAAIAAWVLVEALVRGPIACGARPSAADVDDPAAIDEALGRETRDEGEAAETSGTAADGAPEAAAVGASASLWRPRAGIDGLGPVDLPYTA